MITVTVNGKPREADAPVNLVDYLRDIGVTQTHIAVAHNGVVIRRTEFGSVTVEDGDRLEIVRAVGGG